MNTTKTMRLPPRRHLSLTPTNREERDDFDAPKPPHAALFKPRKPATPPQAESSSFNILLAGYLAHEYLTEGTIFGSKPVDSAQSKKRSADGESEPPHEKKRKRYAEVASLLRTDGARIQGIFNPTQLARFLNM